MTAARTLPAGYVLIGDRAVRGDQLRQPSPAELAAALGVPVAGEDARLVPRDAPVIRVFDAEGAPVAATATITYAEFNAPTPTLAKPAKYRNKPTLGPAPWGGEIIYPSKLQAAVAREHAIEKTWGIISAWATEVSIPVGKGPRGYRRHRVDFVATLRDGRLRITEAKGHDHRDGLAKRRDLEAMGFQVEVRR